MKPVCCDTSFLIALYGSDLHTPRALAFVRKLQQPLTITLLNEFELGNALRFASCRHLISAAEMARSLAAFELDRNLGRMVIAPCNLANVLTTAKRLSDAHTPNGGHRAFDILHVAAALECGAGQFFSFDINQRQLVRTAGLRLNP